MFRGRRPWGGLLAAVLVAAACKSSSGPSSSPPPPPAEVAFPAGFLWGSSTAGFQVEKGDSHADWSHWAATPGKIKNGDDPDVGGPDALAHLDDDIAALTASGQNAYRFSIEWGRVYPTRADFDADTPDPQGLAAYDTLLQKLRAAHVSPLVTLVHFSLPDWLSDGVPATSSQPQGWERPETLDYFAQWCTRAAKRWGGAVDWWATINEPLPYVLGGYVQGSFPPGVYLAVDRALAVVKAEARAHAKCFDAIHAADTVDADGDGKAAWVSVAKHQRTFHPYDDTDPDDAAAAQRVDYIWNQWFLNAIVKGDWDDNLDGTYSDPGDVRGDPTLVGRADFIGVNYYSDTLVSAHRGVVLPIIDAAVYPDHLPTARPKTDFAWDIYPEGFGAVLDETASYGLPMVVTENGLADAADANRGRFLLEHLYQLGWAVQRGDPVLGYFHWALVDNFEWANGYCPHFGLFSYDRTTGARSAKGSVSTYHSIISAGRITRDDVDGAPAYVAPRECP
ncbi:MAG TPA: family 1 glycosylhydrolase [Polyangiaceae bacterium]|jgi:beta-glucosidase